MGLQTIYESAAEVQTELLECLVVAVIIEFLPANQPEWGDKFYILNHMSSMLRHLHPTGDAVICHQSLSFACFSI